MRPIASENSHERIAWLNRYGSESRRAYSITAVISGLSTTLTLASTRVPGASMLEDGLMQPLLEANVAQLRVAGRHQRACLELRSVVARMRVDNDLARVFARGKALTDQIIEPK